MSAPLAILSAVSGPQYISATFKQHLILLTKLAVT